MPTAGRRKDLGKKHTCHACGTRYYDLHRPVPTCPKCGADPREVPEEVQKGVTARPAPEVVTESAPADLLDPATTEAEIEEEEEEEDEDDDKAVEVMADADFVPTDFGLDADAPAAVNDEPEDELADDDGDDFEDEEIE